MKTFLVILGVVTGFLLAGCGKSKDVAGSTETGNTSALVVGHIYKADGPAIGAKVFFVRVNYNPNPAPLAKAFVTTDTVTTDSSGLYGINNLDSGTYNIFGKDSSGSLSLLDSVHITGDSQVVPPDTLKLSGSLSGFLKMQGRDDPASVLIMPFGTFIKPDPTPSTGAFSLTNLAEGWYSIRFMSVLDRYEKLDTTFEIKAGQPLVSDSIVLPLKLPTPTGFNVSFDSLKQVVSLSWDKMDTSRVKGYNVYRQQLDSAEVKLNAQPLLNPLCVDSTGVQDQTYVYSVVSVDYENKDGIRVVDTVKIESAFRFIRDIQLDSLHNDPISLVVGNDTTLYVAYRGSSNGFVGVFDKNGHNILKVGQGMFTQLYDVAVDSRGNIYTVDPDRNRILKFNAVGDSIFQRTIRMPGRILADAQENLFVLYNENPFLVSKFDTSGNILAADTALLSTNQGGMAIGSGNRIFLKEVFTTNTVILSNDLSSKNYVPFPLGAIYSILLNIDSQGNFYLIDGNMDYGKISIFDSTGKKIAQWRPGMPFSRIYLVGNKVYMLGRNAAIIRVSLNPL